MKNFFKSVAGLGENNACEPTPADHSSENMRIDRYEAQQDRQLIDRCLAGDASAWRELYLHNHSMLLGSIRVFLGGGVADPNLIDEIAARVWYAVVRNDNRLLAQYDLHRNARLATFLRTMAKTEISRHFRRNRSRLRRERIFLSGKPPHKVTGDAQMAAELQEFLATLTTAERDFYENHLADCPCGDEDADRQRAPACAKPLSPKARQLRRRIREKLIQFMEVD